jgi:hypothetical protein
LAQRLRKRGSSESLEVRAWMESGSVAKESLEVERLEGRERSRKVLKWRADEKADTWAMPLA